MTVSIVMMAPAIVGVSVTAVEMAATSLIRTSRAWMCPLKSVICWGHHHGKWELDFGANLGIYHVRETAAYYNTVYAPDGSAPGRNL